MSKKHLPDGMRVRWLGHATFDIFGPAGQKFLIDPFLVNNPVFPKKLGAEVTAPRAYHCVLVTHPHADHFEDALPLLLDDPALKVILQFEIGGWLKGRGVKEGQIIGMNTGGTITVEDVRITMVPAVHTSSITENGVTRALGFPIGYVLRFANGFTIYNAGDTAVTMEMKIVHDLYKPNLVILPIGDFYTMGAEQAAYALNLLKPQFAIGGHWGTWNGMPPGTPEALEKELAHYKIPTQLIKLKPGESFI
ncbi:MAG TPA: metal-dependent hydrolase [Candidatus Methylacidiphilales bacterium]|jgi:L-ascorbate metabolism protein UlaG (beta-lactamase superfamily)|nr:metal-dependent hydrolase [Candidatus Methylacidiphilales bacterium]